MKQENLLENTENMTTEEVLENEGNLLSNLLELAKRKEDEAYFRKIEIKGEKGEVKATFRLRPMSSEDVEKCSKQATRFVKQPSGKPEKEMNVRQFQSILIYEATVPEDQKNFWGNIELKRALNVLDNFDMVDKLLLAGEKASVIEIINEMGGFSEEVVETAKN
ncbi:MAG: hypothetical protein R3Y63_09020 [Eubacteriales bacterium]